MKNFYFVADVKFKLRQLDDEKHDCAAIILKIPENTNVMAKIDRIKNDGKTDILFLEIAPSKKEAEKIAKIKNDNYYKNNRYIYDSEPSLIIL